MAHDPPPGWPDSSRVMAPDWPSNPIRAPPHWSGVDGEETLAVLGVRVTVTVRVRVRLGLVLVLGLWLGLDRVDTQSARDRDLGRVRG